MQSSINSLSFKRRVIDTAIAVASLDPAHIVGQGYDGAGKARIAAQQFPTAVYVHCRNHALNLEIVHSTKVRDVRNCLDTVQ